LGYYSLASTLYEKLQNETQLEQVLTSESLLLIKMGRGKEALPIEARLAQAAKLRHAKDAEFTAYMVMAEIYQSEKDQTLAKDILQNAAALLEPDASTIDNKLVLECYGRLAVAYGSLGENISELIAQERAVYIAHLMKDTKDESDLVATIQREIDSTKLHDLAQNALDQGHLRDSLVTSEIIYVFEGTKSGDPNWNRLMTLPFALTKQTNGPDDLKQILSRMGPMLGLARLPILDSLADYYQESSRDLPQAEGYARQSETLLTPMNDSMITLKVRSVCQLAWILARQGRASEGSEKVTECMALATRTDDKESKNTANATNALVRAATNDLGAAESSLRYFLASHPNDPTFHAHLANALAAGGHYSEAVKEFEAAMRLTEGQHLLDATAAIYMQMGWSLNSSAVASDAEKQLASFASARDIYQKSGNVSAEANSTFAIGGYYQKQKDYRKAMDAANRCSELATMAHDEALVARAVWLKGDISGASGNIQAALLFHQQAFSFFKNGSDKTSAILILLAEADNQNALHDPDAAILACRDAANMSGPSTSVETRISIKRSLGWLYLQQGEMEKAVDAFQEERDLAKTSNDLRDEGFSELALSDVYQLLGIRRCGSW
jgi:tetratricopeptide (TPR) repeat protein